MLIENRWDRFWLGLALSNFLEFLLHSNWKRMRSWLGLALNSFLKIPMTFWLKLDEILAWNGSEQFPWHSYHTLIENWWDSGLCWLWAASLKFLLHSNWILLRFWLGLALSSFLEIPTTCQHLPWLPRSASLRSASLGALTFHLKIDEILALAGPEQFPWNSYYILIENWWDSGLGWPWAISWSSFYILIENRWDPGLGWLWAVSLKILLHSVWKLMFLVWAGAEHLPLNLIYILIENWWDSGMGEILVSAGPEHFPLNSNYILINNWWDSGPGLL